MSGAAPPPADLLRRLRRRLLDWYRANHRDLPWRRTTEAYPIWVSEIMLQQTRVDVVVPYWERFLRRFPSPEALAAADEQEVLTEWSGLGYYRRARMLHQAAKVVVAEHGGVVPDDPDAVRALPGVGRYTAGAILSIAFGREEPVLDGNVVRVLCRVLGLDGDPRRQPLSGELWGLAAALARGPEPGILNQALMELGATVCLPAGRPDCDRCPWRRDCVARAQDRVADYPRAAAKSPPRLEDWTVAVCRRRGRYLLRRRVDEDLMADLWELPSAVVAPQPLAAARAALERLVGCELELGARLSTLQRGISGRKVSMHVFEATARGRATPRRTAWLTPAQAAERPLTTPCRRLLQLLESAAPPD